MSEPPRVIRKTTKGELKHARSKRMNKGRKKEKKKKNQINNTKKTGGQNGKVNACAPVNCSLQEPPALARDLVGLSEKKPLEPLACPNWPINARESRRASFPSHINQRLVRIHTSCFSTLVEAQLDPHAAQSQRLVTRNQLGGRRATLASSTQSALT